MRFISPSRGYTLQYQKPIVEHFATGEQRVIQPLINLTWNPGDVIDNEREIGRRVFHAELMRGLPMNEDRVTHPDETYRLSCLDTDLFCKDRGSMMTRNTRSSSGYWSIRFMGWSSFMSSR